VLAGELARQLRETLAQAESGMPYDLCADGSVRSLGDSLLEAYGRVCRVLFRAAGAGVVEHTLVGTSRRRVLLVGTPDFTADLRQRLGVERPDWQLFAIAESYRQLPAMVRLFGPDSLLVELPGSEAVWHQLGFARELVEGRRCHVVGISPGESGAVGERIAMVDGTLVDGPDVGAGLEALTAPGSLAVAVPAAGAGAAPSPAEPTDFSGAHEPLAATRDVPVAGASWG
jgi:hypothetical protein